jgi:hypothetical protein
MLSTILERNKRKNDNPCVCQVFLFSQPCLYEANMKGGAGLIYLDLESCANS